MAKQAKKLQRLNKVFEEPFTNLNDLQFILEKATEVWITADGKDSDDNPIAMLAAPDSNSSYQFTKTGPDTYELKVMKSK